MCKEALNVEADRLAGNNLFLMKPAESEYEGCRAELYVSKMKVTQGLKAFIGEKWFRKGLYGYDKYLMEKYVWNERVIGSIEWETVPTRRVLFSQIIFVALAAHGWLPLNKTLKERGRVLTSR